MPTLFENYFRSSIGQARVSVCEQFYLKKVRLLIMLILMTLWTILPHWTREKLIYNRTGTEKMGSFAQDIPDKTSRPRLLIWNIINTLLRRHKIPGFLRTSLINDLLFAWLLLATIIRKGILVFAFCTYEWV